MITQGFDWFAFTVRLESMDVLFGLADLLKSLGDNEPEIRRTRWYSHVSVFKCGAIVSEYPTSKKGNPGMVELPGKCFRTWGKELEVFIVQNIKRIRPNRVDWRFDFISIPGNLEPVWFPEDFYGLKNQGIKPHYEIRGEETRYSGLSSGKDEFVIRYYDKEFEGKQDLPHPECLGWMRFEWVVRKVLCKSQPWFRCSSIEDIRGIMISLLYKRFHVPFHFCGVLESLPRIRYHGSLPDRFHALKEKIEKDQARLAEMEEQFGCGALQEF